MTRRGWTDWERGYVFDRRDLTAEQIAAELGRTAQAVGSMRFRISKGWVPRCAATEEWTKEDDAILLANPYLSAPKVGKLIGRSKDAVTHRRMALRAQGIKLPRSGNSSPFRPGSRPILAQTCPDCGLLLQAKWFLLVNGGWRKQCTRCRSDHFEPARKGTRDKSDQARRSKESAQKYQALTLPQATNNGNPYTESDIEILSNPDLTIFEKAIALKRSYMAVGGALQRYGYKSAIGLGDPERDQWLIDNPNASRVDEIRAQFQSITADIEVAEPELEPAGAPKRPEFDWDD